MNKFFYEIMTNLPLLYILSIYILGFYFLKGVVVIKIYFFESFTIVTLIIIFN